MLTIEAMWSTGGKVGTCSAHQTFISHQLLQQHSQGDQTTLSCCMSLVVYVNHTEFLSVLGSSVV